MNRNLWGFNPNFKDLLEKKPNITILGIGWASYWRMVVIVLFLELLFGLAFVALV